MRQPPFSHYFTYYQFNIVAVGVDANALGLHSMHTDTPADTHTQTSTLKHPNRLHAHAQLQAHTVPYGNAAMSMNGLSQQTRMAGFL